MKSIDIDHNQTKALKGQCPHSRLLLAKVAHLLQVLLCCSLLLIEVTHDYIETGNPEYVPIILFHSLFPLPDPNEQLTFPPIFAVDLPILSLLPLSNGKYCPRQNIKSLHLPSLQANFVQLFSRFHQLLLPEDTLQIQVPLFQDFHLEKLCNHHIFQLNQNIYHGPILRQSLVDHCLPSYEQSCSHLDVR